MKRVSVAILVLMISACRDENKHRVAQIQALKDSVVIHRHDDYFMIDTPFFLQKNILLDTTEFTSQDSCAHISIRLPKKTAGNTIIYKRIENLRKESINDYRRVKGEKDIPCDDYHYEDFWIEPMHLYQSGKAISYVIRQGRSFPGTPSGFNNHAINFDLETEKEIQVKDFFQPTTHRDSSVLAEIISRSIGEQDRFREDVPRMMMYYECSFGFDSTNVYFFFDSHNIVGYRGSIGVVRRKYLLKHINPKYQ